jgi:hypothetical protein
MLLFVINRIKIKTIFNKTKILYIKILERFLAEDNFAEGFYRIRIIIINYYKKILLVFLIYP